MGARTHVHMLAEIEREMKREICSVYLDLIADINNECIRNRLNRDPSVTLANLESLDTIVSQQYGKATGIGVCREAKREVGLRALGVVVHPHASTHLIPSECLLQESHVQP